MDRRLQKERDAEDLDAFLPCYQRATGQILTVEEEAEDPDFITTRSDGQKVGVELTTVRESPEDSFYRPIVTGNPEWDPDDAVNQMCFLIRQKSSKVPKIQNQVEHTGAPERGVKFKSDVRHRQRRSNRGIRLGGF
jgi:hypothetical protein